MFELWYTHESVKAEAKRKLIYLLLQLCQQRDGETGCRGVSAPGHFYRLLLPPRPHRRQVSWRGFFRGISRTSCVVVFIVLSASHLKRSPPLIYDTFTVHSGVGFKFQASARGDVVRHNPAQVLWGIVVTPPC